jgi:glycosyltransferase involved in cell wall biosynthesis
MRRTRRFNVNGADPAACEQSALLVYLTQAFSLPRSDPAFRRHQNLQQCRHIAAVLGELGYLVDVVGKRDTAFRPRGYDLIVSERLDWNGAEAASPNAVNVFLATSMNHVHHNRNLRRRHDLLFERRGRLLAPRRIYNETMPAVAAADALVAFGNERSAGTWSDVHRGPIFGFNNYGFPGTRYAPDEKDFDASRRHFLYLASRSQMQKGLDLLLEVFPGHPDLHLYVCSQFEREPDFCDCYRKELFETPNVHPIGWIDVFGPEFEELTRTCGSIVAPTCSEGQSGSVVQAMHAGLIPLVTEEAGLDVDGLGVTFADDGLDEIERVIVEVSERPPDWHRDRSRRVREVAVTEYSEDSFIRRWGQMLAEILELPPTRLERWPIDAVS